MVSTLSSLHIKLCVSNLDDTEHDDDGPKSAKVYTEVLIVRSQLDEYLSLADRTPLKGQGGLRDSCRDTYNKTKKKTAKDQGRHGNKVKSTGDALADWFPVARWVKFVEVLESEGKRWSKPHVTTISPHYRRIQT